MRAFWWREHPNFGDQLTAALLARLAGITLDWSPPDRAQIVGAGSIIELLPPGFDGIILGTGIAHGDTNAQAILRDATILCLRGPLTANAARVDAPHADPGILADQLLNPGTIPTKGVCVAPHWQDTQLAQHWPDATVIDLTRPARDVVAAIARHERIVTSSLHAIIAADALHIERRWEPFPSYGTPTKFHDYALALNGREITPHAWSYAPDRGRREMRQTMRDAIAQLASEKEDP